MENVGGECGDDDEWGDLITTPNQRLISDEFFVLKSEEIDNSLCYENNEDVKSRKNVSDGEIGDVNCGFSDCNVWSQFVTIPSGISMESVLDSPVLLPNSQVK